MSHHAYHSPNKLALVFGEERLSWSEMNRRINQVANRFLADGLRRGEKVCLAMPTCVDHFVLMFGAMKAGAVAVPLSALLSPQQIADLARDAGATYFFTHEEYRHLTDPIIATLEGVTAARAFSSQANGPWRSYADWLTGSSGAEPGVRLHLDDEIAISYSSGTTGVPKGVVYSHRARVHLAIGYAISMHIDGRAIGVSTTPLYSNGTSIIMLPVLLSGGSLVFMKDFRPEAFCDLVERERATHTFMVPTQFHKLVHDPAVHERDLSSMKVFLTAGSPMRPDLKRKVWECLGPRLSELYGLSEGGATVIGCEDLLERPTSVGRPLPGFEARILDGDRELPRGEVGEIAFYGGWAMLRYQNRPEQTSEVIWKDPLGRTFIRTGDIGRMDEDGFLHVSDRKKDMIISGGFNVFPADIEAALSEHPDVSDVSVVGVPHEVWGETPVAFVIARSAERFDPDAVRGWANARLAKTQRLHAVVAIADFPRNALGKVQKPQLRELYGNSVSQ